jgi:2-oxoisovalerate dehydrogenase E1 component alpha subunit
LLLDLANFYQATNFTWRHREVVHHSFDVHTMPEKSDNDPHDPRGTGPRRHGGMRGSGVVVVRSGGEALSVELALTIFRQMVRTRALEERSIKMAKSGDAYFWIGGPGEEAFNVCLGLQVHKGRGPAHDYLHLHYRNAGALLAMGMPMIDHTRQLAMRATDIHSRGRNFVAHYSIPAWNVVTGTTVIESQFAMAPGTALIQKRHGQKNPSENEGISIVVGGEAGTAEGDFESCLNWCTQPGMELPVLMLVTNNRYGISTDFDKVHAHRPIGDRAAAYGIRNETIDGSDPVLTWNALDRAMRYCRRERKPFLLEAMVSRLHGHSSSSGAQRNWNETDPLAAFEQKLIDAGAIDPDAVRTLKEDAKKEADDAVVQTMKEPEPTRDDVYKYTYAPSAVDAVYPKDYTGLPSGQPTGQMREDKVEAKAEPVKADFAFQLPTQSGDEGAHALPDFTRLLLGHPEYEVEWGALGTWFLVNRGHSWIDLRTLLNALPGLDRRKLVLAIEIMIEEGMLAPFYRLHSPSGEWIEGEYSEPDQIPAEIPDLPRNRRLSRRDVDLATCLRWGRADVG